MPFNCTEYPMQNVHAFIGFIIITSCQSIKESDKPVRFSDVRRDLDMRSWEQSRLPSIATPEPIVINILHFFDIRSAREDKFIFDFFLRVPRPQSMDNHANTAIRREAAEWRDHLRRRSSCTCRVRRRGMRAVMGPCRCTQARSLLPTLWTFFPAPIATSQLGRRD